MSRKKWLEQLKPGDWVTLRLRGRIHLTNVAFRSAGVIKVFGSHVAFNDDGLGIGPKRARHARIDPVMEGEFSEIELCRMPAYAKARDIIEYVAARKPPAR